MRIRISLALVFVATACASTCAVLLRDFTVAMRPGPAVTAAALPVPPAQVAASTSPLPIVKVALPRAESLNFVTRRNGALAARLAEISPAASNRLAEKFRAAGFLWPPVDATFLAIKDTRTLELFARGSGGGWTFIHRYRVMATT